MICPRCGSELVEVDNPMRPEFRHRRGVACDTFEPPSNLDRLDWGTRNLSDCGRPDCIYCAEVPITHDIGEPPFDYLRPDPEFWPPAVEPWHRRLVWAYRRRRAAIIEAFANRRSTP